MSGTAAEIFLAYIEEVCPLPEEYKQGIYEAKNNMPKMRPKAKSEFVGRNRNKMHSDMDFRFARLARKALDKIASKERVAAMPEYKLPMKNPYRLGLYMQLFYIMPWKEYSLFFPSPWLRNVPNRTKLMAMCNKPAFLKGRIDAVTLYREVFEKSKGFTLIPPLDTYRGS